MNIARLHKKVLFQVNTVTTDRYGNHSSEWKDYFSAWATIGTDSYGSEDRGVVINPEETLNFTTRWCTELAAVESTRYRIICEGKTYNIIFVNPMGYKHTSLKFTGKLYKEKS